ncbi:MAG: hypothetical protein A2505_08975 [Deltaproteobacteria bacterium RIFOXYD12_FULL_55_16]|nr:MAG: hypothetical protein A2505_08975 [Deltaproteobacteria bacterium RIFOXYD12_FULL_55_16]
MQRSTARSAGKILLFGLLVSGCVSNEVAAISPVREVPAATVVLAPEASGDRSGVAEVSAASEASPPLAPAVDGFAAALAGRGRATGECFQLRLGTERSKKEKSGRCEPQSLPFARCRSGSATCRLGRENGPLTWFACEKQRGNTSAVPRPGSILILAANGRRKMPTGHVAYVEEVVAQNAAVYRIVFSHTNYDRRCSLETNIEATYDSAARTLDIHGGAWQAWGKGLPVAGFILE